MNEKDGKEELFEGRWWTYPPMRNALIAGILTGTALILAYLNVIPSTVEIFIYIVAIFLGGYHWSREGIEELIEEKEVGIEILMIAATAGSAILGMWDEAAFLVFLYGSAEGLEEYTYAKTRHSIRKLLDLAPKEARVLRNGREVTIPAEEIRVGDTFIVRPGESVPTDGIILKGRSSINEAPVTGESIPVEKTEGMKVFAATMNQEGALQIKATATFKDNTLSKMIHLVEEAQEQKGRTQLFIESFGRKYTPAVLVSALGLLVIPLLFGLPLTYWATRAVVLLVAAAPCALVMSTPVAIAAGIGKAGLTGVLIKGGIHLENLGKIRVVAFDKTGTLTSGKPVVTDVIALKGEPSEVMTMAYSIERFSEHPLARAIVKKAEEVRIKPLDITDFSALIGAGARAVIGKETVYVGKPELFEKLGVIKKHAPIIRKLMEEGKTVVFVGTEKDAHGVIAIRDQIRPHSREVIAGLQQTGIKVFMLSGDNALTAKAIARELDIDDVRAELDPEDKINAVKELEKEYGAVAMVGDGVNDAPALARATVGIAMGTAGTDAAIEAADVALMADDLAKVQYAISIGRASRRISRQNIVFSLMVLAVLIPSALIGVMTVAVAVFFHEASELIAVANGLRV
ncbi:Lead, cadmium, zinc and mercury transporting ATPase; Copper-translocating P-type ATPase, partial [hydrothermal vent metagenome]